MNPIGGLRLRYIKDSFFAMVSTALDDLSWNDNSTGNRLKPLTIQDHQAETDQEVKPNTVGVSTENLYSKDIELGSNFTETEWYVYIDVLAESESVGIHLAGDIFNLLQGKITAIGRDKPGFYVYQPGVSTPLFYCELDEIEINRVRDWDRPYNKFWWVVACKIVDTYYDDSL